MPSAQSAAWSGAASELHGAVDVGQVDRDLSKIRLGGDNDAGGLEGEGDVRDTLERAGHEGGGHFSVTTVVLSGFVHTRIQRVTVRGARPI